MDDSDSPIRRMVPNLISLWSAMLGGAAGAAAGRFGGGVIVNGIVGCLVGGILSVLIYLPLMMVAQLLSMVCMSIDMDERPIGCGASDTLSAALGGAAGGVGAVIVTLASQNLTEPRGFVLCWTGAGCAPILLTAILIWRARRR